MVGCFPAQGVEGLKVAVSMGSILRQALSSLAFCEPKPVDGWPVKPAELVYSRNPCLFQLSVTSSPLTVCGQINWGI